MRWIHSKRWLAMLLLVASLCAGSAFAEDAVIPTATAAAKPQEDLIYPGLTMEAVMGYDGVITYLRRLPVRITLVNSGADISGVLSMDVHRNDMQFDRYEMPVQVASGAEVQVELPIELTMKQKDFQLALKVDEKLVATCQAQYQRLINPETLLVGVLSDDPQALSYFSITTAKDPLKRGELWQPVSLTTDTFPAEKRMLDTFAFLAVDGVDLNALNERQRATLESWMKAGGMVILGGGAGAANSYPYFQQYTGISAGTITKSEEDITEALLTYVKAAEKPLGEGVMLAGLQGAQNVLVSIGDWQLLDLHQVGDGAIFTVAFSLSDKPLNTWQGANVLWQRLMLASVGDHYQKVVSKQVDYYSRETDYVDTNLMNSISITNDNSFWMPLVLLLIFVVLVGFGSYWLLKKKDKREWLWLTIPVLAVGFSLLLLLIGNWTTFKQPVAVMSDYISQDEDGSVTEKVRVSAAIPDVQPMTVSVDHGEIVITGNLSSYYDTGSGNGAKAPSQLRYLYNQGEAQSITFPSKASWGTNSFFIEGNTPPNIQVKGTCWWEEDGLHIQLVNEGDYAMNEGYVITATGYINVKALLPGETATLTIVNHPDDSEKPKSKQVQYNGNGNIPIANGIMLSKAQQNAANVYSIINAIVMPEMWTDSQDATTSLSKEEQESRQALEWMLSDCVNRWDWYTNNNIYRYITFDDSLCNMTLSINGQTVKRTAQQNVLDIQLAYQPVSASGLAKFAKGMIPVYEARLEGDEVSQGTAITERYRYFRLTSQPAFCFVLPEEAKKMSIADIAIESEYIYGDYTVQLYDVQSKKWVELDPKKTLKEQFDAKKYISTDGKLYVQYLPGTSTDIYAELNTPYITLEGSVK